MYRTHASKPNIIHNNLKNSDSYFKSDEIEVEDRELEQGYITGN